MIDAASDYALPYQWLEHCATTPAAHCEVAVITLEDIARINAVVNAGIKPVAEIGDRWVAFPTDRRGDCDDFAVTKRAALLALGFKGAMRVVLGEVRQGKIWTMHAVLEVDIDGRTWVLDSLAADFIYAPNDRPRPWRQLAAQSNRYVIWDTP